MSYVRNSAILSRFYGFQASTFDFTKVRKPPLEFLPSERPVLTPKIDHASSMPNFCLALLDSGIHYDVRNI